MSPDCLQKHHCIHQWSLQLFVLSTSYLRCGYFLKIRFMNRFISSLLTYLLGYTFTLVSQSIWNLMGFSLTSIFADLFVLTVDSLCHFRQYGHTIMEFFFAWLVFFKFNSVCLFSCFTLGCKVVLLATGSTNTSPSSAVGSSSALFSSTKITCLIACRHLLI